MIVKDISFENFRNYENEKIEFDERINIIHGNNAQGKTNILEGIYLFSLGKSNRASKDAEMIRFGETSACVKTNFISHNREISGEITIDKSKRKKISINDIPVKKNSELVGNLNVVFFGPEYLSLIREGPKKRRKNIDIMISQLKVGYLNAISEYRKLTDQKSHLLKGERIDEILLSVINERIIELSAYIIKIRFEYIKKIEKISREIQLDVSKGKEELSLQYVSCGEKIEQSSVLSLKDMLREKSRDFLAREMKYRECIFGPHRDDIEFSINGDDLKLFGSQGQQKTAILVQKIAEVELFRGEIGEYPILLLDDIMSELDSLRQDYVLNKLGQMQIFVTCTDSERFRILESGRFIKIDKGSMIECTCI